MYKPLFRHLAASEDNKRNKWGKLMSLIASEIQLTLVSVHGYS